MRSSSRSNGWTHLVQAATLLAVVLSCASVWLFGSRADAHQAKVTSVSELRHIAQGLFIANARSAFGAGDGPQAALSDLTQLREHREAIDDVIPAADRPLIDGFLDDLERRTVSPAVENGTFGQADSPSGLDFFATLNQAVGDIDRFAEFDRTLGRHSERLLIEAERRSDAARTAAIGATIFSLALVVLVGVFGERARRRTLVESTREESDRQFRALIADSPDIIVVIDGDDLRYVSPSASELYGEVLPTTIEQLAGVVPADRRTAAADLIRTAAGGSMVVSQAVEDHQGNEHIFEVRFSDLTSSSDVGARVMTCRNVTTEVRLRAELEKKANVDDLTGLPSRRVLEPGLTRALGRAGRRDDGVALLMIDLDGFKRTNDILGHQAGDLLLRSVGERLRGAQRTGELVVRLGGDEFAIVLEGIDQAVDGQKAAERFRAALADPIRIGERTTTVRMSTGLVFAGPGDDAASLLSRADIAMYEAKDRGRNRIVVFEPEMEAEAGRTAEIHRALTSADIETDFHVVYQPIFHTERGGSPVSVEALVRWSPKGLGPIGPDVFVPLAEQSGDIVALGSWVLRTACRQLSLWRVEQGQRDLAVSVNVSAVQLMEDDFVDDVLDALRESGLAGRHLIVEVTESLLADSSGVGARRLEQLRHKGVRVAMDDFGTGYSSLSQLLDLPFDILKVDRSLVASLGQDLPDLGSEAVMGSVVSLADALGIRVVAEGVESLAQLETLSATGIHLAQGYLLARPALAEDTVLHGERSWLVQRESTPAESVDSL